MRSFRKNILIRNLIKTITILSMAIILHSCEPDPIKGTSPHLYPPLASNITQTEATVVAPIFYAESAYFEYGPNLSFGTSISGGSCKVTVDHHCESWNASAKLTGLQPGTTYYCRGVAKYKSKTGYSSTLKFTTLN